MATTKAAAPTDPADKRSTSVALLGSTIDGDPLPRVRRRLTPLSYRSDVMWGWLAPLIVTICAGILQFWNVSSPHNITFDETYYAKDSYSLLVEHYATEFINDGNDENGSEADAKVNDGTTEGIFKDPLSPSLVVHPEVGKWMIAAGEWMFGLTSFGWRFSAALTATLMVLVMCRLVRRLTGTTLLGCVAGALLAFDGLHFVMGRLALLDIFLVFWLLCAVHCLVADRDWARVKLARRYEITPDLGRWDFGPVRCFLFRPWRIAAGVCFGLAAGSKWSAIFVAGGFGLLIWMWDAGMRRSIGVKWPVTKSLVADAIPSFFSIIVVGLAVYIVSWMGFLTHAQQFEDAFGPANDDKDWTWSSIDDDIAQPLGGTRHDLNILWNFHKEVYMFHTGDYIKDATHPFQSHPGGWLVLNRPLGIASTSGNNTVIANCPDGEDCVKQILAIGTPVLWWGGVLALIGGLGYWLSRRDWRFGIPIVGVLTTWLPWFWNDERPIFLFYAVAIIPFTVIGVTLMLGKMMGRRDSSYYRRLVGTLLAGAFVLAVAINFVYFYPIWTNGLLTNENWNDRMWLTKWI